MNYVIVRPLLNLAAISFQLNKIMAKTLGEF